MHPPSTPRRPAWTRLLIPIAVGLLAGCSSSAPSGSTTTAASSGASAAVSAAPADIPALVRQVEPSVVTVLTESGLGSGVVYKTDGTIITDAHVVAGAQRNGGVRRRAAGTGEGSGRRSAVRCRRSPGRPRRAGRRDVPERPARGRGARRGHRQPARVRGHGHIGHHLGAAPPDPRFGVRGRAAGGFDPD